MKVRKVQTSFIGVILLLTMAATSPLYPSSITVSGIISTNTTWSGVDTVKVTGNITINNGVTLTINPGIKVVFQGFYSINVQGRLLAVGTASQVIKFTALNQGNGWNRIILNDPSDSNDSTKIVYCLLEYGKATGDHPDSDGGCLYVYSFNKVLISHSTFQNNSSEVWGGALFCESSNISILNCSFQNNSATYLGEAMYLRNGSPVLKNNLIQSNSGDNSAILFYNSDAVLLNNTISNNNGQGICCQSNADPDITNTIIFDNIGSEIYLHDADCDPNFYYCDCPVPDGLGSGTNYSGVQENCFNVNPGFVGSGNHPYDLSASSPCINTGDPATTTNNIGQTDLSGDFRIMNGRIDIGAYEGFISPSNVPGNCLDFDGVNDYVSGSAIPTSLSAVTLEAWVYHRTLPAEVQRYVTISPEVAVIRFDGTISGDYHSLHFYIGKSDGSIYSLRADSILITDEWTHVAGSYDGANMKLYMNGNLVKSAVTSGALKNPSGNFSFSSVSETLDGKLDEVGLWNVARTAAQIRENMYLPLTGSESGLLSYWQFTESSGSATVDGSHYSNGTLNNMDNSDWLASTIPFATGTSNSQTETNGVVNFTGTDLSMNFSTQNGAVITATKLETAPNINPTGVDIVFDSQYWLVNRYGTGNFNTSLTFTISEDLLAIDQNIPSRIKLYTRPRNSDGAWSFLAEATSVDAVNNKATFSGITAFSQFMVCKNEEGALPTYTLIGNTPDFALITNDFSSIDVGSGSAPTFTDIDGDPFLDLLIGEFDGNINYYEQVSQNSYSFTLVNSNLSSIDIGNFATPCITNLGDDNLLDLIVGEQDANLNYYEQNSENSTGFTLVTSNFVSDNHENHHPAFTDLENDGLLDLMLGNTDGNLTRHEQNSVNSTSFTLITSNFSSIDVGSYSTPFFTDFEDDGLLDVIIGNQAGNLYHYEQNGPNSETFSIVSNNFQSIDIGDHARPTVKDIDNDLLLDLIIGEMYGKLIHYEQQETGSLAFNDVLVGCENIRSYHIRASALTGNLTVTCPDNFTVSLSPESGFGQSIEIVPVDGEIREEVFIRIVPPATGAYSGNISHTNAGVSTKYIAVSANGTEVDNFPGKSLAFDGTNDYVNIADHSSLHLTNNYTLEAWIKPQAFHSLGGIISKYQTSGANGFTLRLSWNSPYNGLNFDDMTTQINILSAGQWYHIAAVNNNGTRTLYVNGEITALSGTPGTVQANDNPLRIGVDYLPSPRYFNGEIDEVRIWNVARTEAQIREFMHQAVTGDKTGLVGYWQLNEESGTQAPEPMKGNTGTLTNMDNADWVTSTAPLPFVSITDGNWSNSATWANGQGTPVKDWTRVRVKNDLVLDAAKTMIDLTVDAAASLVVASTSHLTVSGNLTNNAGTGGLIIEAGGSMIHNTDNVNGTVKTYLTGEPFPADPDPCTMYHLVSVPLNPSNNSVSALFMGGYLYGHIPANNSWLSLGTSTTNDLNEQNGFLVYYTTNSTVSFAGPLNNGTFSPVVTYPGLPDNNNFALVPNPYPSKIDWNAAAGWTKTNIGASIWFFNDGNYGVWNGTSGTNGATRYIAPGQAFFVQTTATSPALTLTNAVRTHQTAVFFKNGNTVENQLRVLASGNETADELLIGFKPDCSDMYNPQEDALKIYGSSGLPQIYTSAGETPLTINNLAQPTGPKTIAMSFECEKAGEYSLIFSQIETFATGIQITLVDELTNQTIILSNQSVYTFIHNTENAANRFKLVFGGTIGINEPTTDAGKMWIAGNTLFISAPKLAGQTGLLEIYSATGQKMMSKTIVLSDLSTLELNFKGFVVARLTAENEIMTVKGIIMK